MKLKLFIYDFYIKETNTFAFSVDVIAPTKQGAIKKIHDKALRILTDAGATQDLRLYKKVARCEQEI